MENNNIIQIEVDSLLMKKMSFIGTMQQIFGVLAIIAGVTSCIGIISAIFGIPYLIAGIKLFKSGSSFTHAAYNNDEKFLKDAILNLASFWLFSLISIIAIIIFYIVFFIIIFAMFTQYAGGIRGY